LVRVSEPTYKDPFHTLAMVYESQGRVKKSLQFFLICGLLDPKNFDDWPRLAELSVEDGNRSQAIMCLSKGKWKINIIGLVINGFQFCYDYKKYFVNELTKHCFMIIG
jgi:hypothetical protein